MIFYVYFIKYNYFITLVAGDSKSVISQVYEVALKMKLPIKFEVLKEDGLPHMKTYITKCTVGTYNVTGEGNGKKVLFIIFKILIILILPYIYIH